MEIRKYLNQDMKALYRFPNPSVVWESVHQIAEEFWLDHLDLESEIRRYIVRRSLVTEMDSQAEQSYTSRDSFRRRVSLDKDLEEAEEY